ncbi:hypothetical protein EIP86_002132 [Pleurotus ostreatoroseus]|nr:hypothetical protein EIP86_002132 [Pleurotus ostreatoroseus]
MVFCRYCGFLDRTDAPSASNARFVDLLQRLGSGMCTDEDYELLLTRVLGNGTTIADGTAWADAPVIVYDNATKDALNTRAVSAWAKATGQEVEWYPATDRHKRRDLSDARLRSTLRALPSGKTNGLIGNLPVVPGMRVIVTKNFDVQGGIVNGSIGTLRSLRSQIAIQPAYAFTAHRAQGQSYDKVVVDLQDCQGSECPYVMLSRARSLEGVLILRPFDKRKICTPPAEGLSTELRRLEWLALLTTAKCATGEAASAAQASLEEQRAAMHTETHCYTLPDDPATFGDRIAALQTNTVSAFGERRSRKRGRFTDVHDAGKTTKRTRTSPK